MEKRLLLAVTFSILVLLIYPMFLAKINPPPLPQEEMLVKEPPFEKSVQEVHDAVEREPDKAISLPKDATSILFSTNRYEFSITNIGGSIKDIKIKDGRRLDVELVEDAIYQAGMLSIEGKGVLEGLSSQPFEIDRDTKVISAELQGLRIEKSLQFLKDKYGFLASIRITNKSNVPQNILCDIATASNISKKEAFESRYIEAAVYYRDGTSKRIKGRNLLKDNKLYKSDADWLILKNKYYSIIAKPEFDANTIFTKESKEKPVLGFTIEGDTLSPGETKDYRILFYIGPTQIEELEKVDPSFGKALNFGMLTSISLVLLSVLQFFYSIFHNYGVAILLLTCSISLLLFPLTLKSLSSMRKLQTLQPKIEKVRAEYKDNPQKLNKEIMELYRREKTNPMGGCFPMLLQMPIFISLYHTLMRSVELKGADFLWIKDLSMPDAAFKLPTTLPFLGNAINLLPILMIFAMILQQKVSQVRTHAPQTEQQKMMGIMMPLVFGFIFYSLPAGLVLYWLTNTVLTTSLQFFLLREA